MSGELDTTLARLDDAPAGPVAPDSSAAAAAVGDSIGSVRLVAVLGQGGMGTVFEGYDTKLDRVVAVKTVRRDRPQDPATRARFRREARTLSRLSHPGVCHVFDLVERPEADYLVLERVQGQTLRDWMATGPPEAARLAVGRRVAEAVAAAHERGVVHRDMKPDNVMVASGGTVKVLDFGLALAVGVADDSEGLVPLPAPEAAFRTTLGLVMGTLTYMSPEQARGEEVGPATDLFALGAVLQELLTGQAIHPPLPFEQLLDRARRGETRLAGGFDGEAAGLVRELLSPDPEARPTAYETVRRLAALEAAPVRRRRRRLAWAATLLAAGLVAGSALVTWHLASPAPLLASGARARLALLPVENATGSAHLDWVGTGLSELVARQLDHLENVELLPAGSVAEVLEATARRPVGEDLPLAALAHQLGADIVIQARARGEGEKLVLEYRPGRPGGLPGAWRALPAAEPSEAAGLLARQLALRLAPSAPPVELRDRLSADPFLNRLYAMGVARLRGAGGRGAETYFRVCLDRDPDFAWARVQLGVALAALGRFEEAEAEVRRAEAVAETSADRPLLAEARRQRAVVLQHQGRREEAERLVRLAVTDLRQRDDRGRLAEALTQLGQIAWERGGPENFATAERLYQEALGLARAQRDTIGVARSLRALGVVADSRWELGRAAQFFREALAVLAGTEMPALRASILNSLGITLHYAGELREAEAVLTEALAINRDLAHPAGEVANLINLGDLRLRRQEWAGAVEMLELALALAERMGYQRARATAAVSLAEALVSAGRLSEAERTLEAAGEAGAEEWTVLAVRGMLAHARADYPTALAHLERARRLGGDDWEERHAQVLAVARAAAAAVRR